MFSIVRQTKLNRQRKFFATFNLEDAQVNLYTYLSTCHGKENYTD